MLSRDIKKLVARKPSFASLLDEATKPYGNSRKHKAAITKEETPAPAAPEPTKTLPFGKSRKHKKTLSKPDAEKPAVEEELPEDEFESDPAADPEADPAQAEEEITDADMLEADPDAEVDLDPELDPTEVDDPAAEAAAAEQENADAIADEVEEQEVAEDEHEHARIMSIDTRKINKSLAELCSKVADVFPINNIREILAQYNMKMVDEDGNDIEITLTGADGNTDVELSYNNGQRISNSALVLYWHRLDNQMLYDVNAYLS